MKTKKIKIIRFQKEVRIDKSKWKYLKDAELIGLDGKAPIVYSGNIGVLLWPPKQK